MVNIKFFVSSDLPTPLLPVKAEVVDLLNTKIKDEETLLERVMPLGREATCPMLFAAVSADKQMELLHTKVNRQTVLEKWVTDAKRYISYYGDNIDFVSISNSIFKTTNNREIADIIAVCSYMTQCNEMLRTKNRFFSNLFLRDPLNPAF